MRYLSCLLAIIGAFCLLAPSAHALSKVCKALGSEDIITSKMLGASERIEEKTYSNGVYVGHMHDGKRCGFGTYYFDTGTIHFGIWENNLRQGIKAYTDGSARIARFDPENNIADATDGKTMIIFGNGDVYQGDYQNGARTGRGVYLSSDGSWLYSGDFNDGSRNGQGDYCDLEAGSLYHGGFRNGSFDGEGMIAYRNGTRYEGLWRDGSLRFGVGLYEGRDSVFYHNGTSIRVRSIDAWCDSRDLGSSRCEQAYSDRAALDKLGRHSYPSNIGWCEEKRKTTRALRDDLLETIEVQRRMRP